MIAFILNVKADQQPALKLVKQVRRHFDQTVIVIGDGVLIDKELDTITKAHSYSNCYGRQDGFWSHRYLDLALQTAASIIIRMEPTACIKQKFVPPSEDWFCGPTIEGFSRAAAEKVVRSGLLLGRFATSCQKQIMKITMKKLGIQSFHWNP